MITREQKIDAYTTGLVQGVESERANKAGDITLSKMELKQLLVACAKFGIDLCQYQRAKS